MSRDLNRLSPAPLLEPSPRVSPQPSPEVEEAASEADMATAISPAPEQLDIHKQPEAESNKARNLPHQFTLDGEESAKSVGGTAKVNRE